MSNIKNFPRVGSGGGVGDPATTARSVANEASVTTLSASQTAQDTLIAAKASQTQVDALQTIQDAEDPYKSFTRQVDGSIDWERESGATGTVAAATAATYRTDIPDALTATDADAPSTLAVRKELDNMAGDYRDYVAGEVVQDGTDLLRIVIPDSYRVNNAIPGSDWLVVAKGPFPQTLPAIDTNNRLKNAIANGEISLQGRTAGARIEAADFTSGVTYDPVDRFDLTGQVIWFRPLGVERGDLVVTLPGYTGGTIDGLPVTTEVVGDVLTLSNVTDVFIQANSSKFYTIRDMSNYPTVVAAMTGADGTNPGTAGAVPAPVATDNVKFLRGDGTWQDMTISAENLIVGLGTPAAATGELLTKLNAAPDGHYYHQYDAANGANDVWGPKAGTWPAQADGKSFDEEQDPTPGALPGASDAATPYIRSRDDLDAWGRSRRVRRIFNEFGALDLTTLGYADRTAIFIRNPDAVNGKTITYGTGGAVTLHLTRANGTQSVIAGQDTYSILQPNEFAVFEKDGNDAYLDILSGERVSYFTDYADAAANAINQVAFDGIAVIRDKGEFWGRKTTVNAVPFPLSGVPNDDWFKIISQDPQTLILNYIEVGMRSSGTNAASRVDLTFVDVDGNNYPPGDWAYSADLTQYAGGSATLVTDKALWTGGLTIGHNKDGTVKFYYTGDFPNGLSAIIATESNGGVVQDVIVTYQGTNYNDAFANVGAITNPIYWTTSRIETANDAAAVWSTEREYVDAENVAFTLTAPATNAAGDLVTSDGTTLIPGQSYILIYDANRAAADSVAALADDAATITEVALMRFVGKVDPPAIALGYLRAVDSVVSHPALIPSSGPGNSRFMYQGVTTSSIMQFDASGNNPVNVTDPAAADWANGVRVLDLATGDVYQYNRVTNYFYALTQSTLDIVRYTADGPIEDRDHRAIFETGAVNMTLSASTADRLIQMVSEGPATIITADGAEEFTSSGGTSTDQKLTLNETFQWATIIGRTSGGWSQYVGQVGIPDGVDIATPTMFKAGTRLVQNGIEVGASIIFPEAFKADTIPTIKAVAQDVGDNVNVTLQTVTNTGFLAWVVRNESDVGIGAPIIHWEATGEAA